MLETVQDLKDKIKIDPQAVNLEIQQSIIHHQKALKKQGAIIGLSGGLDSAVVTALCNKVLGKENIKLLLLPDSESSRIHLNDALDFAQQLDIPWKIIAITPLLRDLHIKKFNLFRAIPFLNKIKRILYPKAHRYYEQISGETPFSSQLKGLDGKPYHDYIQKGQAILHAKHRLRMVLLYYYAEQEDRAVIGCTNKTEQQIGFYVKYGCDHLADLMPIINLYKTQIRQLAEYLGIPSKIIQKEPSPDLLPGLDDRTMIGMPYEQLDLILLAKEQGLTPEKISQLTGIEPRKVKYILDLVKYSKSIRESYLSGF